MLWEIRGEITPERMKGWSQSKNNTQLWMELVIKTTWNVRSMNQCKLKVVKQEMERLNIDILGIRELRWTGMGKFNSDDHYIYYCGQFSSVQFSRSLVSDILQPHESPHARPPCPSSTPGVHSNSCPLSR